MSNEFNKSLEEKSLEKSYFSKRFTPEELEQYIIEDILEELPDIDDSEPVIPVLESSDDSYVAVLTKSQAGEEDVHFEKDLDVRQYVEFSPTKLASVYAEKWKYKYQRKFEDDYYKSHQECPDKEKVEEKKYEWVRAQLENKTPEELFESEKKIHQRILNSRFTAAAAIRDGQEVEEKYNIYLNFGLERCYADVYDIAPSLMREFLLEKEKTKEGLEAKHYIKEEEVDEILERYANRLDIYDVFDWFCTHMGRLSKVATNQLNANVESSQEKITPSQFLTIMMGKSNKEKLLLFIGGDACNVQELEERFLTLFEGWHPEDLKTFTSVTETLPSTQIEEDSVNKIECVVNNKEMARK